MHDKLRQSLLLFICLILPALTFAAEPVPAFQPPAEDKMPTDDFGKMVQLGKDIFTDTGKYASKYVGNKLSCGNCHLDAGRLANSAPLWAAWVKYPAYRGKNKMVNTYEERLQGCFRYSMNGTPPPAGSDEIKALMSYSFWLATGAPTNTKLPGAGYPKLPKPEKPADFARGQKVFTQNCALCHGADGQGTEANGRYVFPPLLGQNSFNWGAGMHRINTAASFIHANMPLGKSGTLSIQDAWDVAYFMNSHPRPQDPRYTGNVKKTKQEFHHHLCRYGDHVDGQVLGAK
jgi:thiosulfate dehydrogenase